MNDNIKQIFRPALAGSKRHYRFLEMTPIWALTTNGWVRTLLCEVLWRVFQMSVFLTGDRLFNTGESSCISDRIGRRNARKGEMFHICLLVKPQATLKSFKAYDRNSLVKFSTNHASHQQVHRQELICQTKNIQATD